MAWLGLRIWNLSTHTCSLFSVPPSSSCTGRLFSFKPFKLRNDHRRRHFWNRPDKMPREGVYFCWNRRSDQVRGEEQRNREERGRVSENVQT